MQRLNELRLAGRDGGFRTIPVERPEDPFYGYWYPAGHPIGWAQSFTHQAIGLIPPENREGVDKGWEEMLGSIRAAAEAKRGK